MRVWGLWGFIGFIEFIGLIGLIGPMGFVGVLRAKLCNPCTDGFLGLRCFSVSPNETDSGFAAVGLWFATPFVEFPGFGDASPRPNPDASNESRPTQLLGRFPKQGFRERTRRS